MGVRSEISFLFLLPLEGGGCSGSAGIGGGDILLLKNPSQKKTPQISSQRENLKPEGKSEVPSF